MVESARVRSGHSDAAGAAPAGVRGWLLLFSIGLVPHLALAGSRVFEARRGAPGAGGTGLALAALTLAGHGAGLLLTLRRHRLAPAFFTLYLPLSIAAAVLTPGVGAMQAAEATRLGMVDPGDQARVAAGAPARVALAVAVGALWVGYWVRSRRVRATFGSAGLEVLRGREVAPG